MQHIHVTLYVIPGGEAASFQAYDAIVLLLEAHPDLFLTIYRGINRADGRWTITLIGEKTSLSLYQEQIQCTLEEVHAEHVSVPPESVAPLIQRFLDRQNEMAASGVALLEKHHPLSKKQRKKTNR